MELTVTHLPDINRWQAVLDLGDDNINSVEPRAGCALRTVLNTLQYKHGEPSGNLKVTIEGW